MPRQFQEMAAKSLHIPADVALGEPVITITGRRRVYLENYERILSLDPDEIRFGAGGELFLQLGDVKVALGTGENLDEKISRLKQLEGDLKDKSGTLHMENYTDETTHISLESAK